MSWDIRGKQVLITGGTSGIGRATASQLARRGAAVTITSRTAQAAHSAAREIAEATAGQVSGIPLDLGRLDDVRRAAAEFRAGHDRLDVLINNAGIISGPQRQLSPEAVERTFAVNHLGPFLLTHELGDLLSASRPARVINVSSAAYRGARGVIDLDNLQMEGTYHPQRAYAVSKLAVIRFTDELCRRIGDRGVTARVVHPGVAATGIVGPGGTRVQEAMVHMIRPLLKTPAQGAATSVHLATASQAELSRSLWWADGKPAELVAGTLDFPAVKRLWDVSATLAGTAARKH
ncbi:MAG: SDR family NAD(P)-dependent oxidoreductase [Arachnia sp.]